MSCCHSLHVDIFGKHLSWLVTSVSFTCVWHHISRYIFNFTYQNNLNLNNIIEAWSCSLPSIALVPCTTLVLLSSSFNSVPEKFKSYLGIQYCWGRCRHSSGNCVCINPTSGGQRSLATPAYQGRLALVSLLLGAAVNKIKSATLTLPSAQGRPLARLHPTFPRNRCSTGAQSRTKLQFSSSSSMIAGPAGPCTGRSKPLSFTKSKSIGWSHQNGRIGKPLLLTAPA